MNDLPPKNKAFSPSDTLQTESDSVSRILQKMLRLLGERFANVSLNSWAVYAIHSLSELGVPATKETITVALFRMYPDRWSMVGFPDYPDSDRVNRALLQLRPKYRNWAYGDSQLGWTLTDGGKNEAERMVRLIKNPDQVMDRLPRNKKQRLRTRPVNQNLMDLEDSALYRMYSRGETKKATRFELWACFGSSGLTPPAALESMRQGILKEAQALDRSDLVEFLNWVRGRFLQYFQA